MSAIIRKKEIVGEIISNSQQAKAVIFYNFHQASNENIFLLKKELKKSGASWKVYKNTLVEKALTDNPLDLKQANALIFCHQDEYQSLKILNRFDSEQQRKHKINGGIFEQKFVSGTILTEWAKLPSKERLLQTFCYLLQLHLRRLVKLLEQLKEQKS